MRRVNALFQPRFLVNCQTLVFRTQVLNAMPKTLLHNQTYLVQKPLRTVTIKELEGTDIMVETMTGKRKSRVEYEVTISPKKLKI